MSSKIKLFLSSMLCLIISACENESIADEIEIPKISLFLTKKDSSSQGMTIFNNRIFVFKSGGKCDVYDFVTKQFVSSFEIESSNKENHCNCVNWGTDYVIDSAFPLLYITNGKRGAATEWHCRVEKISCIDDKYSSKCLQTIVLDVSRFKDFEYYVPWGCPQWLIDRERGNLWIWSANVRTLPSVTKMFSNNLYHATRFRLPKLSEGNTVILTAKDVLEQVSFEFDAYTTQGGCMSDGIIFYSYGFGNQSSPSKIRIYDTDTKLIRKIDLEGRLDVELEDLALYQNRLFINTNSPYIYEIDFTYYE